MLMGTVEAIKKVVALGLGMSIVPDVSVAEAQSEIVVRPLRPPVPCTLGLIEHSDKPNEPALEIVRTALLTLQTGSCLRGPLRSASASRKRLSAQLRLAD